MDNVLFSRRLKQLREECGYRTQAALARAYDERFPSSRKGRKPENEGDYKGVYGTIKNYENPNWTGSPNLRTVYNLCKLLECSVDYLLGNIDCKTHSSQSVYDIMGLSEGAIEAIIHMGALKFADGYYTTSETAIKKRMLSEFLESTHFRNMMTLLECYGMDRISNYSPNRAELLTGGDLLEFEKYYDAEKYLNYAGEVLKDYFRENAHRIVSACTQKYIDSRGSEV